MIYKQEPITNTVTIKYEYKIHPAQDNVTKVSTASVQTRSITPYKIQTYQPIRLMSVIPFDQADSQNLTDYTQEITPIRTTRFRSFGSSNVLVTIFTLNTTMTYHAPDTDYSVTKHWKRYYRMAWRIPSHFQDYDIEYFVMKEPIHQINSFTARNDVLLSVSVLSAQKSRHRSNCCVCFQVF